MSALVGPYEAGLRQSYTAIHLRLVEPRRLARPALPMLAKPAPEPVVIVDNWKEPPTAQYDFGPFGVGNIYAETKDPFRWRTIVEEVARKHGFQVAELLSARRYQPLVNARYEAMWRLKYETNMSLPTIGRKIGGRDHTTVIHGIRAHEARIDKGEAL